MIVATSCVADIVFVIDNSGSIREKGDGNWILMLGFLKAIVSDLTIAPNGTRIAAVDFGNEGHLDFGFSDYSIGDAVKAAIDRIPYRGENTNMTGGLKVARQQVFEPTAAQRPGVDRAIILITDGVPTWDADKLDAEVYTIKNSGIRIVTLGVTNQVRMPEHRRVFDRRNHSH